MSGFAKICRKFSAGNKQKRKSKHFLQTQYDVYGRSPRFQLKHGSMVELEAPVFGHDRHNLQQLSWTCFDVAGLFVW